MKLFLTFLAIPLLAHSASIDQSRKDVKNSRIIQREFEPIDGLGKYHVQWEADLDTSMIVFTVVVETTGFVGFGFSRGGGMSGADIVIGGMHPDGSSYFSDHHGIGNEKPVLDTKQDYEAHMIMENATHTSMQFSRLLNTCDDQDVAISADTLSMIWAYGSTDTVQHHAGNRGIWSVNLLDPPMPPFDESSYNNWELVHNATMPTQETTYWCSIHKSPASYVQTRHVIGFNTKLETAAALKHAHHLDVYKCVAPPGEDPDAVFGRFVGLPGGECYVPEQDIPVDLCGVGVYAWAVGGKMMTFPENVGYPITENGPEYFMILAHFNNPNKLAGVVVETTIEVFNTRTLRDVEAGLLAVLHLISYSHLVPPRTENYVTVGHCSSECTRRTLRPEGINVFNVFLHAHTTGRRLRVRQFRNRTELPWISSDDNYDFNYQQNRPLREPVKVLPGDHLTTECVQDTRNRPNVTTGGLSTNDEMCQGILYYYPAGELRLCESSYNETKLLERFGIEKLSWDNILNPPLVLAPESMANKTYAEVLNTMVDWNPEMIEELQQETRYNNHYQVSCGSYEPAPFNVVRAKLSHLADGDVIGYPELDQVYVPPNDCAGTKSDITIRSVKAFFAFPLVLTFMTFSGL